MSIRSLSCAMLLVLAAAVTRAQVVPTPPIAQAPAAAPAAPATPGEMTQSTTVHGTPMDLSGRWLVLFDMSVNAVRRTMPFFLEFTTKDGKPQLVEHFVNLPPDMAAEVEKHNAEQTPWQPTPAQLGTLAAGWGDLPKSDRAIQSVTSDIWEPSAFTEQERQDVALKDALWVVRETYVFAPGGQRPTTQVNVFAGKKQEPTGWTGTAVVAQVLTAPFPVPITLQGSFRMLRLDPNAAPPRGLLARILDAFSGCRR